MALNPVKKMFLSYEDDQTVYFYDFTDMEDVNEELGQFDDADMEQ